MSLNKKVFINCPYDDDYKHFFAMIVFYCFYFGYEPVFASEEIGAQTRIDKIINMISNCEFGIHDISKPKDRLPRYNMAFELGLDFMSRHKSDSRNKLLILEKKQNQYTKTISDLGGCDIAGHNNDSVILVDILRRFFVMFDDYDSDLPRGNALFEVYIKTFNKWIQTEAGLSKDETYEKLEMAEIKRKAKEYFRTHKEVCAKKEAANPKSAAI